MLENLCREISKKLSEKEYIEEDEIEMMRFGIEIVLSQTILYIVLIGIGLYLHRLTDTVIFVLVLTLLKKYSGGFHAKTFVACTLLTITNYLIVMYTSIYLYDLVSIILVIVGFVVLYLFSPQQSGLSKLDHAKFRDYGIIVYCLFVTVAIILYLSNFIILSNTISLTLFSVAIMLMPEVIKHEKI